MGQQTVNGPTIVSASPKHIGMIKFAAKFAGLFGAGACFLFLVFFADATEATRLPDWVLPVLVMLCAAVSALATGMQSWLHVLIASILATIVCAMAFIGVLFIWPPAVTFSTAEWTSMLTMPAPWFLGTLILTHLTRTYLPISKKDAP